VKGVGGSRKEKKRRRSNGMHGYATRSTGRSMNEKPSTCLIMEGTGALWRKYPK